MFELRSPIRDGSKLPNPLIIIINVSNYFKLSCSNLKVSISCTLNGVIQIFFCFSCVFFKGVICYCYSTEIVCFRYNRSIHIYIYIYILFIFFHVNMLDLFGIRLFC